MTTANDAPLSLDSPAPMKSPENLLPDGTEIVFTVSGVKYDASEETKKRNDGYSVFVLSLACDSETHGATIIKEKLRLCTSWAWKIEKFLSCIGLIQSPGKPVPSLRDVMHQSIGRNGRGVAGIYEQRNGERFNNVSKWYEGDAPPLSETKPEPAKPDPDDIPF